MITKEQLEAGCEVWIAGEDKARPSIYGKVFAGSDSDDGWHSLRARVCGKEVYHSSKHEAELFILRCKLNDN